MSRNIESRFSKIPSVDIGRSRFDRSSQHKTTGNAGELLPIYVDEVLPGDTFTMDLSTLCRMSTPIFPTMDNAFLDTYFFYVPSRIVWEHWKEFMGENTDGYWTPTTEYNIPTIEAPAAGWDKGSIADYFGIPTNVNLTGVNALPFRAYALIWNEWFRDQNTMPPVFIPMDDSTVDGAKRTDAELFEQIIVNGYRGGHPLPVCKYHDYFTSCLPEPQKGPAVDIPLFGNDLPVTTGAESHWLSQGPMFASGISSQFGLMAVADRGGNGVGIYSTLDQPTPLDVPSNSGLRPQNLYVDLDNITYGNINQLRQAFQIQKLYEKDARGGTRYREMLSAHFGVQSPDSRMQVPEYLGGKRIPINIDQVLQTSETTSTSPQGNTAAFSLTTDVSSVFTKSFTEHGYIIGLACVRTDHTYQQGVERFWSRQRRFDFYWPTLANIGEQAVLRKELCATGHNTDEHPFGYQEAWADYRYKPSRVSGAFRSNYAQSLDSWHYADYYEGLDQPYVVQAEWIAETKNNIDRTLAVSSAVEDQFLFDFYFKCICTRPMPMYSVPGLIDHN